jgi:hypothetical protein
MSGPHGDGGLVTTTVDLLRWNSALDAGAALSRASVDEMFTPTSPAGDTVKEDGYGAGWIMSTRFNAPYQYRASNRGG